MPGTQFDGFISVNLFFIPNLRDSTCFNLHCMETDTASVVFYSCVQFLDQGSVNFSILGNLVNNILGFAGHMVSVAVTHFCHCNMTVSTDGTQAMGVSLFKKSLIDGD